MSSQREPRLGWYGLGSMGIAMASNLQKHLDEKGLPAIHYANRNLSKGEPLKAIGGIPCQDINELVQSCDVIFTSVSQMHTTEGKPEHMITMNTSSPTMKLLPVL